MKDYEADIKEIMKKMMVDELKEFEEILKKLQEYTNKHENNYLPLTQAFNPEYEAR